MGLCPLQGYDPIPTQSPSAQPLLLLFGGPAPSRTTSPTLPRGPAPLLDYTSRDSSRDPAPSELHLLWFPKKPGASRTTSPVIPRAVRPLLNYISCDSQRSPAPPELHLPWCLAQWSGAEQPRRCRCRSRRGGAGPGGAVPGRAGPGRAGGAAPWSGRRWRSWRAWRRRRSTSGSCARSRARTRPASAPRSGRTGAPGLCALGGMRGAGCAPSRRAVPFVSVLSPAPRGCGSFVLRARCPSSAALPRSVPPHPPALGWLWPRCRLCFHLRAVSDEE